MRALTPSTHAREREGKALLLGAAAAFFIALVIAVSTLLYLRRTAQARELGAALHAERLAREQAGGREPRVRESWSLTNVGNDGWFVAKLALDDGQRELEFRISPQVRMQSHWTTGAVAVLGAEETFDPATANGIYLEGQKLALDGDELAIGEKRYGSIEDARLVLIQPGEVLVDGEKRGSLP